MVKTKEKIRIGTKAAMVAASVAGRKLASKASEAGDKVLVAVGDAARKRGRKRAGKTALAKVGTAAVAVGIAAATIVAGRAAYAKVNGKAKK